MGGNMSNDQVMSGMYHSVRAGFAPKVYDTNGVRNLSGCQADYTRAYGERCPPFHWGASCCIPQMGVNRQQITSGGYKPKTKKQKSKTKNQKTKIKNKKQKNKNQKKHIDEEYNIKKLI